MPITLNGTTGEIPATWTTATRPASPTAGQIGYNTTTAALDVYNGTAWTTALPATSGLATLSNLALNGSTSGTTTLSPSATASGTVTLPAGTGTVAVNGVSSNIVQGTSVASTSGTAITFTGIPSWVKRITIMLQGVTTSGTSQKLIQLGTSGGFVTTGYLGAGWSGSSTTNYTNGFGIYSGASSNVLHGNITVFNLTNNTWVASGVIALSESANVLTVAGSISAASLGGVLTQIRLTTVNGTDTFTAGNVNILYE
jgi:hypothetical protein